MEYKILTTDVFRLWWQDLSLPEQEDVLTGVTLLRQLGPTLPYPYSSSVEGSKYSHMRELRIQHWGQPYRVLYAFDPKRQAILLTGGNKTGNKRWYKQNTPIADRLYKEYLDNLNTGDYNDGPKTF